MTKLLFNFRTILIIIFIIAFLLIVIQVLEIIRFNNYGKVPFSKKVRPSECFWRHNVKSSEGIDVPHCTRPKIFRKSTQCQGQCKHMRYKNIPEYQKSLAHLIIETILVIVNTVILAVTLAIEAF